MKRQFELRNGIIVEEKPGKGAVKAKGFIDDYTILKGIETESLYKVGIWLCLGLPWRDNQNFPIGDSHGTDFDIIKEIKKGN